MGREEKAYTSSLNQMGRFVMLFIEISRISVVMYHTYGGRILAELFFNKSIQVVTLRKTENSKLKAFKQC